MKQILVAALLALLSLSMAMGVQAKQAKQTVAAALHPVGGSGVSGVVFLKQRPNRMGTEIKVLAMGLTPGHRYRSLYYGNATCQIEPYSSSDVIGGDYVATPQGRGHTQGKADDNLDAINSVSVRDASQPFSPSSPGKLLACAQVMH